MKQPEPNPDALSDAQVCIVWHPLGVEPAPDLLRALAKKGMRLIGADDPHRAFADACFAARSAQRTILVLEARAMLRDVDRVCSALERFAPETLCWAHEPGANPPLIPLVHPRAGKPKPGRKGNTNPSPPQSARPAAPLRLVGQQEAQQKETNAQTSDRPSTNDHHNTEKPRVNTPLSARDVLDADELDALLAGELGDRKN